MMGEKSILCLCALLLKVIVEIYNADSMGLSIPFPMRRELT